jgi:hypothetical protein
MNVDFFKKTISKPKGKRTPAANITFDELDQFIKIWNVEIGKMLACARTEINKWRIAGRPTSQIRDVLHGIVVIFGEGNRFVWPKVKTFLSVGQQAANGAIKNVDTNISKLTTTNILLLFQQMHLIKGLGSKHIPSSNLISGCSYSSKVLRCLCDDYVVLDDLFEDELGERYYIDFREKCEAIGKAMNPSRSAAEVESGLYAWLQILNPCQKKLRWKKYQNGKNVKGAP